MGDGNNSSDRNTNVESNTEINWLINQGNPDYEVSESDGTCASCWTEGQIVWLRLITDWEDYLTDKNEVDRHGDNCEVPLCTRCRAWAEMIEIAEMTKEHQEERYRRRIDEERTRFLESLSINLIQGIRVSEDLSTYTDARK